MPTLDTLPESSREDRIPENEEILLRDEWFLGEEKESPRPPLLESESFQFTIRPFTKRHNASGEGEEEDDYNEDRFSLVSIMEPTKPDLPVDLQRLSILWSHGNIFRAFPSPPTDIPGSVLPSPLSPLLPTLAVPVVGLHVQSPSTSPSPTTPSTTTNCSTTWSVLEMYNTPESPPQIPSTSSSDLDIHTPHQPRRHLPFPSPSQQQQQSPSPSKKSHPHPTLTLDDMIPPLTLKKRSASVSGPRPIRPLPSIPRLEPPTMPNECSPRLPPPTTPNPPTPGQMIRGPRPRTKSNNSVRSITLRQLSTGRVIL
ncbi:hypothetical protein BDZ89DRAFT_1057287 [Hymenopellis radicata]|nr:hypothetical protein BDZ89DRAFT_1057287 [Hymenopellis radicata]